MRKPRRDPPRPRFGLGLELGSEPTDEQRKIAIDRLDEYGLLNSGATWPAPMDGAKREPPKRPPGRPKGSQKPRTP